MQLYGAPMPAPNPRRVRMFLAEKGLSVPETHLDFRAREHKSKAHRARNSLGQVPVLELDDGTTISESGAICRWFEETYPEPPLFGVSALEKAHVDMWVRRIEFVLTQPAANFWRHAHPYTAHLLTQHKEFGESNRTAWAEAALWLDRELADQAFIAGEAFTIADICALSTVDFANWIGLSPPDGAAHLAAWRERVSARPSASA